jgi:hypothetical protein
MPFQPGNQEARKAKKAKPFRDALRIEMAAAEQGQPCPAPKGSLRWNARQLLERGDPVSRFQAMLENAVRICEAKFGVMFRFDGDVAYAVATQPGWYRCTM